MSAGLLILVLKVAVISVTVLLAISLWALSQGRVRLHGQINRVFFALTMLALIGLEVVARLIQPEIFDEYITSQGAHTELRVHLAFAVPSAILLPIILFTGLRHYRIVHIGLALAFCALWIGTFVTGVFFLPHAWPG